MRVGDARTSLTTPGRNRAHDILHPSRRYRTNSRNDSLISTTRIASLPHHHCGGPRCCGGRGFVLRVNAQWDRTCGDGLRCWVSPRCTARSSPRTSHRKRHDKHGPWKVMFNLAAPFCRVRSGLPQRLTCKVSHQCFRVSCRWPRAVTSVLDPSSGTHPLT
jgi:hypothetical protein